MRPSLREKEEQLRKVVCTLETARPVYFIDHMCLETNGASVLAFINDLSFIS